jgi:hypothetical protein
MPRSSGPGQDGDPTSARRRSIVSDVDWPRRGGYVDAAGLARYFALQGGKRAAYKLVECYDIPHIRIGRRLRFDVEEVRRFLEERTNE